MRKLSIIVLGLWLHSVSQAQIPDIPTGSIKVRTNLLTAGLTPEEVQENPVGFTQVVGPTDLTSLPGGSFVVVNYGGKFSLLDYLGNESPIPFLDLSNPASPSYNPDFEIGQAHGATSIVLHPGFTDSNSAGFKTFYTLETETALSGVADFGGATFPSTRGAPHHDNVLYEYTLNDLNDVVCGADCNKREVLRVLQPGWHHNVGDLVLDADGMLFIGSGDGSTDGTTPPFISDNSTILTNAFGKVLRIDPLGTNSANGKYGVPNNPFVDGSGGNVDEIYAYGLRNPYRLSFDAATGNLYTSETGELKIESVDRIVEGGNYGWNLKEGSFVYDPTTKGISIDTDSDGNGIGDVAQANGLIDPLFEYDRDDGRSIIGGVLYRGSRIPELYGHYVFADFNGRLFYGDPESGEEFEFQLEPGSVLPSNIHSVSADANGELYVLGIRDLGGGDYDGWVVRLVPEPSSGVLAMLALGMILRLRTRNRE